MDLQKLKVTELRAELQARGLDTKGVKAQLIDRLKEALDIDQQQADPSATPAATTTATTTQQEPPETPRLRRSSRSRTRSPEPVATTTTKLQDPSLEAVQEEESEDTPTTTTSAAASQKEEQQQSEDQKDTEMYEKIIDEMEVDQNQGNDDYDEDALLAESNEHSSSEQQDLPQEEKSAEDQNGEQKSNAEPMETTTTTTADDAEKTQTDGGEEENRGVKRRAESPSKETSPKKRQRLPPPNIDDFVNDEDEPELDENLLQLSWFDSDLNLKIDRETFCSAQSLFDTGLALVWAGARANYGAIANGKYFYEVQLLLFNNKISYPNERNLHEIRCGWSPSNSSLQLGESELSFGLDSSGKKCLNSEFTDYTAKLCTNDIIGVHLELTDEKCSILYTVNGKDCGVAFEFEKSSLDGQALFPHISTKNVEYKVNFGALEKSLWSLRRDGFKEQELKRRRNELEKKKKDIEKKREDKAEKLKKESEAAAESANNAAQNEENNSSEEKPATDENAAEKEEEQPAAEPTATTSTTEEEAEPDLPIDITEDEVEQDTPTENCLPGYTYIANIPIDQLSKGPRRPENRTDCEVIMMIGLPGAGKSHWALEHAKENPDKRYTMLGTKYLLEKMKIGGQPRKRQNNGPIRWEKLIELCNRGLLTLNEIACKRRRNYILDQPHVYISDQRRKMRVYGDFKRIACIVVPKEEDYKTRIKKRLETEGKDIHDAAVNEMRANITLPELEYLWFNEIIYSDLEKEAAVEEVTKENERGKRALNQRNRQPNYNQRGGPNNYNQPRWGGNQRNDYRRNNWGAPNRPMNNQGGGYNRNFDGGNRSRNNWNDNNNWNRGGNQRSGYGGPPPPRPGGHQKRPGGNNQQQQQNRNDRFRQGGGNNNRSGGGGHKDNRGQGGMKKFGGKSDWAQGNQWAGGNWGNNYQNWNNQWNQNQYGGSNSNADNSGDTNSQWMAYYQQQQQQNQNWFSSDGNYGGAFSSNSNYDSSQTKQ